MNIEKEHLKLIFEFDNKEEQKSFEDRIVLTEKDDNMKVKGHYATKEEIDKRIKECIKKIKEELDMFQIYSKRY